jgi:phage tail-like protein
MAQSLSVQAASYPLAAYNFRVTVGSVAMGFAEVTGLTRQYQTLTYRHGLSFAEGEQIVRWRIDQFSDMTLRRGVVQGMAELRAWLEAGDLRNITVSLCDADGTPVVSWRVQKALPVALEAPALQADSNSAAVETLSLKVAGISVETH